MAEPQLSFTALICFKLLYVQKLLMCIFPTSCDFSWPKTSL